MAGKAIQATNILKRLMPNVGKPSESKRTPLMSVANSKLFYASSIRADISTKFDINRKAITRAQRIAAIRVIRGFRSVSADAALVLAKMPPGDLLALERGARI